MFLVIGPANDFGQCNHAVGGKGYAIEASHHGVGIDHAAHHSRRPRTTQKNLFICEALAGFEEDLTNVTGRRRREGARFRVEGHDDDQNKGVNAMARTDVQSIRLAHGAAIVQTDDDVWHHLHRR